MTPPENLRQLINIFLGLINPLLIVLAGLSLLVFFKGLAAFIFKSGDPNALEDGRTLMKWGLVALFVMVSLIAIIGFFRGSFGWSGTGFPLLPGGLR